MKPDYILLRFGELTLKGKNRHMFENRVVGQVQRVLKSFPEIRLKQTYGRIYVELNGASYEDARDQLQKVFGLYSFSPVVRCGLELESIRQTALAVMKRLSPSPRTFKVKVKRAYKAYEHTSQELNHLIGGYILKNLSPIRVDVHDPEIELQVEIRNEGAYVFSEVVKGPGGLPWAAAARRC